MDGAWAAGWGELMDLRSESGGWRGLVRLDPNAAERYLLMIRNTHGLRTPSGRLMGSSPHSRKFRARMPLQKPQERSLGRSATQASEDSMGEVIMLAERREAKRLREPGRRRARTHAEFFFDLACPFTYLAAERVERSFDDVVWRPAVDRRAAPLRAGRRRSLCRVGAPRGGGARRRRCGCRWSGRSAFPPRSRPRCAWPRTRPSAVAAPPSCWPRRGWRSAAASTSTIPRSWPRRPPPPASSSTTRCTPRTTSGRDAAIEATGRSLLAAGADRLPALRLAHALYWGEPRVGEALVAARVARVAQL